MRKTYLIILIFIHSLAVAQESSVLNLPLSLHLKDAQMPDRIIQLEVKGELKKVKEYVLGKGGSFRHSVDDYSIIGMQEKYIEAFSKQSFVKRIIYNFGEQAGVLNDTMLVNNRIVNVQKGDSLLRNGYTGKDVLIGFIDTGIDFSHPDFKDSTGKTRIIAIWDQAADTLVSSRIPRPYGYGQIWDSSAINAAACPHDDDVLSHGTNVAGIATGNGLAVGRYVGAAPEASIAMVATDFSANNWLSTVADGVEYLFHLADSLGMPCVVNISAGTYSGSHDGSDPAAKRIDQLIDAKKGRAVVCAAGNLGTTPMHLGYNVTADTNFTWFNHNTAIPGIYYELWSDTADFDQVLFAFGADKPGSNYQFRGRTAFTTISSRLNVIYTDSIMNGSNRIAYVQTYAELVDDKYLLQVFLPNPDSSSYKFRLMTTGNGKFDIWSHKNIGWSTMDDRNLPSPLAFPDIVYYKAPDTLKTLVSSYACSPKVLTVGNYINRDRYVDVNNVLQIDTALFGQDIVPGQIADNSCSGPTRKGLMKPNLSASGDITLTANRLASIPLHIANNQANRIAQGGMHKRNGGTSMAAPVVSGIVALYLERCPNTAVDDLIQQLQNSTYQDSFSLNLPNYKWGYGKADGLATLRSSVYSPLISPHGLIGLCEEDSMVFTAASGYQSYRWQDGDSALSKLVKSAAKFSLFTTDSNGCPGYSDTAFVFQHPITAVPIVINNSDTLKTTHQGPVYQWYKNDTIIPFANQIYFLPTQNGDYQVEVTDTNGCKKFSMNYAVNWLAAGDQFLSGTANQLKLYPNPGRGIFRLTGADFANQQLAVTVLDLGGREVPVKTTLLTDGSLQLNLENHENGMYQAIFRSSNGVFVKSVLINR